MKTAKVLDALQTALEEHLPAAIIAEAEDYGKDVPAIARFDQGIEDPMRLQKYPALMICLDSVRRDRVAELASIPIDLVVAVSAPKKSEVMDAVKVYLDAIANYVGADPTIGGAVFEARFESAEIVGPTPGNGLIGVLIARLTVHTDDLLQ
jgi:hypothetical protein